MSKLITKARAGVTLVELLVVILIVTILSVSMLPLLQPFVTESQYAAEPIPVIGNLRTKLGLYEYDKGALPAATNNLLVQTWIAATSGNADEYEGGKYDISAGGAAQQWQTADGTHFGTLIDVNFQDLKGKRSKPLHYHYYPLSGSSYVIGCFGDGNGLKAGTGYAVCELTYPRKKYLGTWKRYKPATTNVVVGVLQYQSSDPTDTEGCYVPSADDFETDYTANATTEPAEITRMKTNGWEF